MQRARFTDSNIVYNKQACKICFMRQGASGGTCCRIASKAERRPKRQRTNPICSRCAERVSNAGSLCVSPVGEERGARSYLCHAEDPGGAKVVRRPSLRGRGRSHTLV